MKVLFGVDSEFEVLGDYSNGAVQQTLGNKEFEMWLEVQIWTVEPYKLMRSLRGRMK